MRDNPIGVGDVVRLKSGGPPMTVHRADGDAWECLWSAGDDLRSAVLASDVLEPDDPRSPKPVITPYRPDGGV
jgi:uncharacterized protein YodC (DUF2158 family)